MVDLDKAVYSATKVRGSSREGVKWLVLYGLVCTPDVGGCLSSVLGKASREMFSPCISEEALGGYVNVQEIIGRSDGVAAGKSQDLRSMAEQVFQMRMTLRSFILRWHGGYLWIRIDRRYESSKAKWRDMFAGLRKRWCVQCRASGLLIRKGCALSFRGDDLQAPWWECVRLRCLDHWCDRSDESFVDLSTSCRETGWRIMESEFLWHPNASIFQHCLVVEGLKLERAAVVEKKGVLIVGSPVQRAFDVLSGLASVKKQER